MCSEEANGNQHRGCPHFVILYYSGERYDCNQPNCALSKAHAHPNSRTCPCNRQYTERRKVMNIIQEPCDHCKSAAMAHATGASRRR